MSCHHSNSSSPGSAVPLSRHGWICFVLPDGWQHKAIWRVRISETITEPGVWMIAPAGNVRMIVEMLVALPGFQAQGTLTVDVEVQPDVLTEITLPLTFWLNLASARRAPTPQDE